MLPISKVAAGVVLYHPDTNVISNIGTYYNSVDYLIVIDNSEKDNGYIKNEIQKLFPGVIYRSLNRNAGIAAALNIACSIATENNCNWILTMDQDSSFKPAELKQMIDGIPVVQRLFENIGIISPFHVLYEDHEVKAGEQYTVKNIVMTSGNLLNLSAYAVTGPFEEKLFMDFVDYEYCLRLKRNKFKIIQDNFVHLKHSLGDFKIKKIFSQKIGVSNHNFVRRYYMTRNSLYVGFKYFRYDKKFFFNMLKNIFFWDPLIIIRYEKDKLAKLKAVCKGIFHFVFNKFGRMK
jgi:rhamnosyltransferase